jgi:hypothetical protein
MDFIYGGDMVGMPDGNNSMNDAFGKASTSKGPLDSPEENFPGRAMDPAVLADPANAQGAVSGARPPESSSFDCMIDHFPSSSGLGSSNNEKI